MRPGLPPTPRGLRIAALLLGIAVLFWLPIEDTHPGWALGFAFVASAWWGMRLLRSIRSEPASFFGRYLLVGGLCGLVVAPLAALLMVIKNGLHAHGADFSIAQIEMVFQLIPVYVASGCLLAIGAALFQLARRSG